MFRSLFAAYPDGLIVADAQGRIVLANDVAGQAARLPVAALVGLPVEALVPDAIRPRHADFRRLRARPIRARWARRWTWWRAAATAARWWSRSRSARCRTRPALRGGGDPRHRLLPARAARRCSARLRAAQFGRVAVDAPRPRAARRAAPRASPSRPAGPSPRSSCCEANRLDFRVAGVPACCPGESRRRHRAQSPDTLPGRVLPTAVRCADDRRRDPRRRARGLARAGVRACAGGAA